MASIGLVSILCPDRVGLVSAITSRLFELGINLGDASFAVLGGGAEFKALCEMPAHLAIQALERHLRALPELADAQIAVMPHGFDAARGPSKRITHRVEVSGGDQPGLVARLSEIFTQFGANIVRMDAQKLPAGAEGHYVTRFAVSIPEERADHCLAAVKNTAGHLGLSYRTDAVFSEA